MTYVFKNQRKFFAAIGYDKYTFKNLLEYSVSLQLIAVITNLRPM